MKILKNICELMLFKRMLENVVLRFGTLINLISIKVLEKLRNHAIPKSAIILKNVKRIKLFNFADMISPMILYLFMKFRK